MSSGSSSSGSRRRLARRALVVAAVTVAAVVVCLQAVPSFGMRNHLPWAVRHWCDVVETPHWPFAYQKQFTQTFEEKGLVASSNQHMGHVCVTRGARTKCNICEEIECGVPNTLGNFEELCGYQVQVRNRQREAETPPPPPLTTNTLD